MLLRHYFRLAAATQLLPVMENGEETTLIGGQAVMEGVMMRAPHSYCVAVRQPDGEIITQQATLDQHLFDALRADFRIHHRPLLFVVLEVLRTQQRDKRVD